MDRFNEFVGVRLDVSDRFDDGGSINVWVDGNTNGDGGSVFDGNTGRDDCGSANGGSTVD